MMNCSPLFLLSTVLIRNTLFCSYSAINRNGNPIQRNGNFSKETGTMQRNRKPKNATTSKKCNHPPKNATAKASCFVALFNFIYFPFIWFKRNRGIFSRFLVCCFSLFYVLLQNKKRNDFVSIVAFRCGKSR